MSILSDIQAALDSYFERTGDDIYVSYTRMKCVVCGEDTVPVYHPKHGVVVLDVDHDGYGNRRDIITLHECVVVPTYACKICKDTGSVSVDVGEPMDTRYVAQPCPNPQHKVKRFKK